MFERYKTFCVLDTDVQTQAQSTVYEGSGKSRADSAAWSHESYMKDPEKSRVDNAARSRKIYEKDLEKSG